ncbi:MAG: type I 3-dehydroquinate dehydratase [Candidatus Micrarchaeota archaeon]|nr:type I 3-dehydroquinate dehydratase [Candidatus Micrarchaeota archaeon]MBU1681443.1 type I 3-dehydroquinate dehydratase [Candidatus Micrarchaeota archaeon]
MICTSIAEEGLEACLKALDSLEFAEVRLDKTKLSEKEVVQIFSTSKKLIATYREGDEQEIREKTLMLAIDSGASMVDIELESTEEYRKKIIAKAREKNCEVIISYHNYEQTPSRNELEKIIEQCFEKGADIAKIACKVNSEKDNARLLGLLDCEKKLVVIGMGRLGRVTRILGPLLGSKFTFASAGTGKETAEGQLSKKEMEEILEVLKND